MSAPSFLCLLDVHEERLVFGDEAVRVAHVRGEVVRHVILLEAVRPAPVMDHAHLVDGLAIHGERHQAVRHHGLHLDVAAVVQHADGVAVGDALLGRELVRDLDELTGLVYACALMRPSKSVMDLEVKSVKKKFKSPAFAANVNRQVIAEGAERLGMPLDDVIRETILGMREIADSIGLAGSAEPES